MHTTLVLLCFMYIMYTKEYCRSARTFIFTLIQLKVLLMSLDYGSVWTQYWVEEYIKQVVQAGRRNVAALQLKC